MLNMLLSLHRHLNEEGLAGKKEVVDGLWIEVGKETDLRDQYRAHVRWIVYHLLRWLRQFLSGHLSSL